MFWEGQAAAAKCSAFAALHRVLIHVYIHICISINASNPVSASCVELHMRMHADVYIQILTDPIGGYGGLLIIPG